MESMNKRVAACGLPFELKADHRRTLDRIAHEGVPGVFQSKSKSRELLRLAHGLGDVTAHMHGNPSFGETDQSLAIFRVRLIVQGSLGRTEHVDFQLDAMLVLYLPDALGHVGPRELLSAWKMWITTLFIAISSCN